jgi:predicted transcriptional regulator
MAESALTETLDAEPVTHRPKGKRLTQTEVNFVYNLHREGLSQVAIAQRLGVNQSAISRWLDTLNDSTPVAKAYLKGNALKMARNVVQKGRAQDHVATLKGLGVLEEQQTQAVAIMIGIKSDLAVTLSPEASNSLEVKSTG